MEEVVFRRYKRLLNEGEPLPQLIIVDGGKGQLSSGLKALETLGLRGKIAIVGIAKRLEEIYYPDDSIPLYLDKKSESSTITGIGEKTSVELLKHFRSISNIKKASKKSLAEIIGNAKAQLIYNYYNS